MGRRPSRTISTWRAQWAVAEVWVWGVCREVCREWGVWVVWVVWEAWEACLEWKVWTSKRLVVLLNPIVFLAAYRLVTVNGSDGCPGRRW